MRQLAAGRGSGFDAFLWAIQYPLAAMADKAAHAHGHCSAKTMPKRVAKVLMIHMRKV